MEDQLGETGRVLVRYSGTELLARVMLEGRDLDEITRFAHGIAEKFKKELG